MIPYSAKSILAKTTLKKERYNSDMVKVLSGNEVDNLIYGMSDGITTIDVCSNANFLREF